MCTEHISHTDDLSLNEVEETVTRSGRYPLYVDRKIYTIIRITGRNEFLNSCMVCLSNAERNAVLDMLCHKYVPLFCPCPFLNV